MLNEMITTLAPELAEQPLYWLTADEIDAGLIPRNCRQSMARTRQFGCSRRRFNLERCAARSVRPVPEKCRASRSGSPAANPAAEPRLECLRAQ
jgi:hypothetical protein